MESTGRVHPAAPLHVEKPLPSKVRDPTITRLFFETPARNHRVIHVAKKLRVAPTGEQALRYWTAERAKLWASLLEVLAPTAADGD